MPENESHVLNELDFNGAVEDLRFYKSHVVLDEDLAKCEPHCAKGRSGSITGASPEPKDRTPSLVVANSSSLLSVPGSIRKRSGSMPAFKLSTLAMFWNLRKEQVRALRMTWARLCEPPRSNCKGIVNLVERVWEKLDS
ncbi:hypothetical protein OSTOST_13827, partial [Ostertagia ostertagi]